MWAASGRGTGIVVGRSTRSLEVMQPQAAFLIAIVTYVGFAAMSSAFLRSVQREAPEIYEAWGRPTVSRFIWRRGLLMPFSEIVLFGGYREVLAAYPASRAWASWLSVVHWLELGAFGLFIVSIFWPRHA